MYKYLTFIENENSGCDKSWESEKISQVSANTTTANGKKRPKHML